MKKALITGITGQDGAYLTRLLLAKGYQVAGLVRDSGALNLGKLTALGVAKEAELIPTNLLDLSDILRVLGEVRPDEIYNLAAQSSVGLSFRQPIGTVEFNLLSTIQLLEAVKILGLSSRFYQASSSEMYGRVKKLPITEETAMHPVSPYAVSKAAAHWMTVHYREAYGMFAAAGILFNHESALRDDNFVTKKILTGAVAISRGRRDKLRLGNLAVRRDWGYSPAYVEAMWAMLQAPEADDYVIAGGRSSSLEELVAAFFGHFGLDWQEHVVIDPKLFRPADIDEIYGDAGKAKARLGWDFSLSLPELVSRLIDDYLALEGAKAVC
ncbi:MAG: GDP-mannose 4,6-dehydratase [Deltaproteobacteria bacterium]|nr:GDP-mannose 4,6-dehydratase [Deltaproteobacteria bacterium]